MIEPTSSAESEALREFGWHLAVGVSATGPGGAVLEVYRAGFRDGRRLPEVRVFLGGDAEPGPEVAAVMDVDGDIWKRHGDSWGYSGCGERVWSDLLGAYGPLVAGLGEPFAGYGAAVEAEERRRAAAGDAR